jgi:protoporphyrinogen oxidase
VTNPQITILGGGSAGLVVGYWAGKAGIPFVLVEASDRVGGNCATLVAGGFR